jgi:hypothetical protein
MKSVAFVEHADRELDLLCLARMRLKRDFDIDLEILNVSADAPRVLRGPVPTAVFFSSFYSSQWPLRRDYVSAWPNARVVNLAWEQIFCPIDEFMHRPLDEFARTKVRYLAWSADYHSYLQRNGVDTKNITIIGHPLYQLYDAPYRDYFKSRAALAKAHGIDATKPWVFIPENYGFTFISDAAIAGFASPELPEGHLREIRSYCRSSMIALGNWAEALARIGNVEVVFRPRPSVDTAVLRQFLKCECGISREHFKLIKAETAREWVLASDVVMSSYSTVLIEASLAGKALRRIEPTSLPRQLQYDWCSLVSPVATQDEFLEAAAAVAHDGGSERLRAWARAKFFLSHNPVERLVEAMAFEIKASYLENQRAQRGPYTQRMPNWLSLIDPLLKPRARDWLYRKSVPGYTHKVAGHDKDFFDARSVEGRTRRWKDVVPGTAG